MLNLVQRCSGRWRNPRGRPCVALLCRLGSRPRSPRHPLLNHDPSGSPPACLVRPPYLTSRPNHHAPYLTRLLVVPYPQAMSFLASHQRGYDSLSHPDLSQQPPIHPTHPSRHPMHPLSSYDNLPLPPAASVPAPSMVSTPAISSYLSDRSHIGLPKVGETRCCESFPIYPSDRSSIDSSSVLCSSPPPFLLLSPAHPPPPRLPPTLILPYP